MSTVRALLLIVVSGLTISLLACGDNGDSDDGNTTGNGSPAETRAQRFADCGSLRSYLLETAATEAELSFRYGAWDDVSGGLEDGDSAPASQDLMGGAEEREFSDTNTQEEGVDEADFVKTDGEYLYLVSGSRLLIVDAWPAEEMRELSRLELGDQPFSLFVHADKVVVFSRVWAVQEQDLVFAPQTWSLVKLTVIDAADKTAPSVVRDVFLEGDYADARMVDGRVHVVIHSRPVLDYPPFGDLDPVPDEEGGIGSDGAALRQAHQELDLDDLLPQYQDVAYGPDGTSQEVSRICSCENFFRPDVPNGTGVISLVTLDLSDPNAELESVALAGNSGVVYGAEDSIYVATRNDDYWFWWPLEEGEAEEAPEPTTVVHKFSLGASPTYQASGKVDGWVLNQFSMSEFDGVFRVATTEQNWRRDADPVNSVYLLEQQDDGLSQIGALTGLGKPGEQIYSVRFVGERGFVVTFEQIDPLIALDLSDPTLPSVAGELEVPGFSTYLHPVGDTHLLAVGQNTNQWGVDLSLFDVRDLSAPTLVQRTSLGAGSYSEAQYEHKAFTYFPSLGALAIPLTLWNGSPFEDAFSEVDVFTGLYLFDVDLESGFTKLGSIDHASFYRDEIQRQWYYPEPIRRSFFIGDGGTGYFVYTVSGRGLKATDFADLDTDVSSIELPAEDVWWVAEVDAFLAE